MPIRTKYREVIDLINEINGADVKEWEDDGRLKMIITVKNEHDKKLIINKINEANYMNAADIEYEFKFDDEK